MSCGRWNTALDEFALIAHYFRWPPQREQTRLAGGDDAALLAPPPGQVLAISTDTLLAGRHYDASIRPEDLGWKALAVNLSDLLAMAAEPLAFTLALSLPEADEAWLQGFAAGLRAHAPGRERGPDWRRYHARAAGHHDHRLWRGARRAGAAPRWRAPGAGRLRLGPPGRCRAGAGASARRRRPRCGASWIAPSPRSGPGAACAATRPPASISRTGSARIWAMCCAPAAWAPRWNGPALPRSAAFAAAGAAAALQRESLLHGGDDYELLVAADAEPPPPRPGQGWTRIGRIEAEPGLRLREQDGTVADLTPAAWTHF